MRILFAAALGDDPVFPHFYKAHFAASRADAVPRPKQLSQDVLFTARLLQGTKLERLIYMRIQARNNRINCTVILNLLKFLTLLFQSCFYLATYRNKTTWWKVSMTWLQDSDPVSLLMNLRLLQVKIRYLRPKYLEFSFQSSSHELHLWPGHLMRHLSSVLALISYSLDWEVTCGLWGSHSWYRQLLSQEKKKSPSEEWCIKPLTNKNCVVCYQSKYLQRLAFAKIWCAFEHW